jgi:hypothetical protein
VAGAFRAGRWERSISRPQHLGVRTQGGMREASNGPLHYLNFSPRPRGSRAPCLPATPAPAASPGTGMVGGAFPIGAKTAIGDVT